jgi:uncharacterized lipoprotein
VNKIVFLALAFLLTGCGTKYPLTTNLNLQVGNQTAGIYSNDSSATLKGRDTRKDSAVVVYQLKDEPEMQIPNQTAPNLLVTERLAIGLQAQGLLFESASPVRIQLDLDELLVSVTRPKILYIAKAKSRLTLTVKNGDITLTKNYNREANQDSVTRPPVHDLEKMLNDQLTEIVTQILQDEEVREAINKNSRTDYTPPTRGYSF